MGDAIDVLVDGGVFSATRLDPGTRVLLEYLEQDSPQSLGDESGRLLDIGCGWGAISLALGRKYPSAAVTSIDVNRRALENTRRNAERNGITNVHVLEPSEISPDITFDAIWSNPPIRIGKPALHGLLSRWLSHLAPAGSATLVVAKQLGAPSLQRWLNELPGFRCLKLGQEKGYWVLRVTRAD